MERDNIYFNLEKTRKIGLGTTIGGIISGALLNSAGYYNVGVVLAGTGALPIVMCVGTLVHNEFTWTRDEIKEKVFDEIWNALTSKIYVDGVIK